MDKKIKRAVGLLLLLPFIGQIDAYEIYSNKKGVGAGDLGKIEALNVSWYYNWSISRVEGVDASIEYVPMKHNKNWKHESALSEIGEFDYFLGFNEPERENQGNITVEEAIAQWPNLHAAVAYYGNPGAQMGSPATANPQQQWIIDFMSQVEANSLQVDFMVMHKYPGPQNSDGIMNGAQWYHNTYGKPVWITEFNAADWNAPNDYTHQQCYTWLAEVLFRLESTDYIHRYAIFPWDGTSTTSEASGLWVLDENGNPKSTYELTPIGKLYAEYRSNDIEGPYENVWYYLHNRGSEMRLADDPGNPAVTSIYTEGNSVEFELIPAGAGSYHIVNQGTGKMLASDGTSVYWTTSDSGSSSQWNLISETYNWMRISHVGSGKYLYGQSTGVVGLGSSGTGNIYSWTFIRTGTPFGTTGNDAPTFTSDPIKADAASVGINYSGTIANNARDSDGDPLTFSKIDGPAWLTIAPDGDLSGTPGDADFGLNTWTAMVTDGISGIDTVTIEMSVLFDVLNITASLSGEPQKDSRVAEKSYDNDELTRWANIDTLESAWIEYDLGELCSVDGLEMLLYNGSGRTYPIEIRVDDVVVFEGRTNLRVNYWRVDFTPAIGRYVTVRMTGPNSSGTYWFSIWETIVHGMSFGPLDWRGYPVYPDGWVNTGSLMGWVWVGDPNAPSDWVWSVRLRTWMYTSPSQVDLSDGGWFYVPK